MPAGAEEKPQACQDSNRAFENSSNESLDTRPLGTGGLGYRARVLCLPGLAQLLAPCEDIGFGLVEARIDAGAFYCVAGSTAGHEIARIFLPFMCARNHEIDAHDQRVFETRTPIQTTIATDIIIAIQNLAAFFNRDWGIHKRKRNEAKRHKNLPGGSCAEQEGRYDFHLCGNDVRTDRRRCQDVGQSRAGTSDTTTQEEMRAVVFPNRTGYK